MSLPDVRCLVSLMTPILLMFDRRPAPPPSTVHLQLPPTPAADRARAALHCTPYQRPAPRSPDRHGVSDRG